MHQVDIRASYRYLRWSYCSFSGNRFYHLQELTNAPTFCRLRLLSMNNTLLTWQEVSSAQHISNQSSLGVFQRLPCYSRLYNHLRTLSLVLICYRDPITWMYNILSSSTLIFTLIGCMTGTNCWKFCVYFPSWSSNCFKPLNSFD